MPGQGRLGDKASVQSDAHGCPACPHAALGPAISGSPNVNVNGMPALRVDDRGMHAACCATNTWQAKNGSSSVNINGKPAFRMNDPTVHCGGNGKLIEGSANVIVGGAGGGGSAAGGGGDAGASSAGDGGSDGEDQKSYIEIALVDADGEAVANEPYIVKLPDGSEKKGYLDASGCAVIRGIPDGQCQVSFPELDESVWQPIATRKA